jgi:Na+/H+ antiporter NhaD/arsenite permease-like protein
MPSPLGQTLPLWSVSAFALILLAIAVLPLACPKFFYPNRNKFFISLVLGLPVIFYFAARGPEVLIETGKGYVSFILLLLSLFVISGGIVIRTNLRATPLVNTAFLLLGSLLASFMGTTGAAMLLIRPLLDTNQERTKVAHTVLFFTFLVANIGGCLTPLGDPPLFMGYLAGVPFEWTFTLFPEWAAMTGAVLIVYWIWDTVLYRKEPPAVLEADRAAFSPLRIRGLQNLPLLIAVVLSVAFLTEDRVSFPIREIVLILLAVFSWWITPKEIRKENKFTFYPIVEVAVLFFGIFATMICPILILKARGAELGIQSPASFFWAAGSLSSFLDNTPTYMVFFSLAQSVGVPIGGTAVAATGVDEVILRAVSLGAVFMGANTYIGNAPNFMVKSIAEERNIKMPSFFGYMVYSVGILVPLFLLVTILFF